MKRLQVQRNLIKDQLNETKRQTHETECDRQGETYSMEDVNSRMGHREDEKKWEKKTVKQK